MRVILALVLSLWPCLAHAADILGAVRAERWAEADAAASGLPDPLARKLVTFYRLLTPGAARSGEIAAFMVQNADWPLQALLSRRLAEALAVDRDDRSVLQACRLRQPDAAP